MGFFRLATLKDINQIMEAVEDSREILRLQGNGQNSVKECGAAQGDIQAASSHQLNYYRAPALPYGIRGNG